MINSKKIIDRTNRKSLCSLKFTLKTKEVAFPEIERLMC